MRYLLIAFLSLAAPLFPCTAFYAYNGELALAGNNEDFYHTKTRIWFIPAEEGRFGRVYLGYDDGYSQGAMNEKGLFMDGFATRPFPVKKSEGKPVYQGNFMDDTMATCATVQDVVDLWSRYDLSMLETAMLMFADRHGDSVIIEGDEFLRIEGRYQVTTNFYQSAVKGDDVTCWRFKKATAMLEENDEISVEKFRKILDAVHVQQGAYTQYSNICDLTNGKLYLYHFYNFDDVKVFDLQEELKKGAHTLNIPDLFPENPEFLAYEKAREKEKEETRRKLRDERIGPEVFDEYTGNYLLTEAHYAGATFGVYREGDKLMGKLMAGLSEVYTIELIPCEKDRFFQVVDYGTMIFTFERNDKGAVKHLTRELLGRKWKAVKTRGGK